MKHFIFTAVCLIVSFCGPYGFAQAKNGPQTAVARTHPAKSEPAVRFENGELTVKVKDIALEKLLGEIGRLSGLTLVCYGSLAEHISIAFKRLPLEAALRRILSRKNYSLKFVYQSAESSRSGLPGLISLWLFDKGGSQDQTKTVLNGGSQAASAFRSMPADITDFQSALRSEDPAEREEAIEALGESGDPEAVPPLGAVLQEGNEDERIAGIVALVQIGSDEAAERLAIALEDENPLVRQAAAIALEAIGDEDAARLLEKMMPYHTETIPGAFSKLPETSGQQR